MVLSEIRFHTPETVDQALQLLGELKKVQAMAGGTDLLVDIKQGLKKIENIISLHRIEEIKVISRKNNEIRIGAGVAVQEVIQNPVINQYFPVLGDAAKTMASSQIRSMATIGGNISSAVPSADLPPSLIAADSLVELQSIGNSRRVLLSEFFSGPRTTVRRKGELLTSIIVPLPPARTGFSYQKFTLREANALAVAAVASRITLKKEMIEKAAIVLGAVAPVPLVASKASGVLEGMAPSPELFEKAASIAKKEAKPITDIRGSMWYRRELIQVLTRRSLDEALKRAQKQEEKPG